MNTCLFTTIFTSYCVISLSSILNPIQISKNCLNKQDGRYILKLLPDDEITGKKYPLVSVLCSNEYMLIDRSNDDGWESYFSSWIKYHYAAVGPIRNDHKNWQNWFLPTATFTEETNVQFLISPDCKSCDINYGLDVENGISSMQIADEYSAYYYSALAFGCFNRIRGWPACDLDFDTYACKICSWDSDGAQISSSIRDPRISEETAIAEGLYTGVCDFEIRSAVTINYVAEYGVCAVAPEADAKKPIVNFKPSLGIDGRFCVCAMPGTSTQQTHVKQTVDEQASAACSKQEANAFAFTSKNSNFYVSYSKENCVTVDSLEYEKKLSSFTTGGFSVITDSTSTKRATNINKHHDHHTLSQSVRSHLNDRDKVNDPNRYTIKRRRDSSEINDVDENVESVIKLYQKDFLYGTYRIQKSNQAYKLMEHIVLDFNGPPDVTKTHSDFSMNDPNSNYYWPDPSDEKMYPGATEARNAYFLGFFAGITVEADNIIIDLNGFEIQMSKPFYYAQPFFSIIELCSQPFLPQQGPGFFGSDPIFPENIIIKNGVLGLSSHHGIHGNYNKNVLVENVWVRNFQTHGIQFNGYDGIVLRNVEIGPTSVIAFLNGNYNQMRLLMPTLQKIAISSQGKEEITFNGRDHSVSMQDLVDDLVAHMDIVYNFVMFGSDTLEHLDADMVSNAMRYFINPRGLPFGAVTYGLFLNYPSAGIFGWHVNDKTSNNAVLEKVEIHGLRHSGIEVVGLAEHFRVYCNAFNGPLSLEGLLGGVDAGKLEYNSKIREWTAAVNAESDDDYIMAHYVGNLITDIHIAMYYYGQDNWDYWAGIPFYGVNGELIEWALGENEDYLQSNGVSRSNEDIQFKIFCNGDAMFHPAKGLLGMKISGSKDVNINNLKVYDMQDETPLGNEEYCPKHGYSVFGHPGSAGIYHVFQQYPYQQGFSMDMVHAITIDFSEVTMDNIEVQGIYSNNGLAFGMAAWFDCQLTFGKSMKIHDVVSGYGSDAESKGYTYSSLPNKAAEVCAYRFYTNENHQMSITYADDNEESLLHSCISGTIGCYGSEVEFSTVGRKDTSADACVKDLPFTYATETVEKFRLHIDLILEEQFLGTLMERPSMDFVHKIHTNSDNFQINTKRFQILNNFVSDWKENAHVIDGNSELNAHITYEQIKDVLKKRKEVNGMDVKENRNAGFVSVAFSIFLIASSVLLFAYVMYYYMDCFCVKKKFRSNSHYDNSYYNEANLVLEPLLQPSAVHLQSMSNYSAVNKI